MATRKEPVLAKERQRWLLFGLPFSFTVFSVTDRKLLIKRGLLNRTYDEILLYRVTDLKMTVKLSQSLLGLGLGNVTVYSKDVTDSNLEIKNIRHYREFYNVLSEKVERERQRHGVRASELIGSGGDGHYSDGDHHDYDDGDSYADTY